MPQVRCPNCGTTINLETRKETDFNLIINALHKNPKTFTQLLNYTRLPRKTLSLRLKELCDRGVIIKDGGYHLSESYPIKKLWGEKVSALYDIKKTILYSKKNVLLLLILLSIGLPVAAKAYTILTYKPPEPPLPKYVGTFIMELKIKPVTNVCFWQVKISFEKNELATISVHSGDFFKGDQLLVPIPLDEANNEGILLLGGSQLGPGPGESGSGILAKIEFGIKNKGSYKYPEIVFGGADGMGFGTFLAYPDPASPDGYKYDYDLEHLLSLEPIS
jgi:hypothetical protein